MLEWGVADGRDRKKRIAVSQAPEGASGGRQQNYEPGWAAEIGGADEAERSGQSNSRSGPESVSLVRMFSIRFPPFFVWILIVTDQMLKWASAGPSWKC